MLIAFYVARIVLVDMVTNGAAPGVNGYDFRFTFGCISKQRASRFTVGAGDNEVPFTWFANVQGHRGNTSCSRFTERLFPRLVEQDPRAVSTVADRYEGDTGTRGTGGR